MVLTRKATNCTADGVKAEATATRQAEAAATLASILAYGVTKSFFLKYRWPKCGPGATGERLGIRLRGAPSWHTTGKPDLTNLKTHVHSLDRAAPVANRPSHSYLNTTRAT